MTIGHGSRGRSGQTIYQVMLVMSCAALAIAATFPTLEYLQNYRGPVQAGGQVAALPAAGRELPGASTTTTLTPAPAETAPTTTLPATTAPAEQPAGG